MAVCLCALTANAAATSLSVRAVQTPTIGHALVQVQAAIGAKQAVAFDLTAACSGFVLGLVTAAQYIRTGMAKHVLVIGADAMSRVVDWRDRSESLMSALVALAP